MDMVPLGQNSLADSVRFRGFGPPLFIVTAMVSIAMVSVDHCLFLFIFDLFKPYDTIER